MEGRKKEEGRKGVERRGRMGRRGGGGEGGSSRDGTDVCLVQRYVYRNICTVHVRDEGAAIQTERRCGLLPPASRHHRGSCTADTPVQPCHSLSEEPSHEQREGKM